jgi:SIR2-like domain
VTVDSDAFSPELLRTFAQDAHLSFLIGAGTPAGYFSVLGGVEDALTGIEAAAATRSERDLARASVLAYFYETVLRRNRDLVEGDPSAQPTVDSYGAFGRAVNRVLLRRRSTLLDKRVCLFTTNVDLMFEVAFDHAQIPLNDGFSGRFTRVLDTANFGTLRFRTSVRYDQRSEMPTIDLVKLHGSVDWVVAGSDDPVEGDPRLAALQDIGDALKPALPTLVTFDEPADVTADHALSTGQEANDAVAAFLKTFDRLALVLPEKAKFASTLLARTYYELLRRLANELERENSLLLVHGFSFRDEHLRDLVLRAGRTNPTLQVVVFC